jgi:hypothetical protein
MFVEAPAPVRILVIIVGAGRFVRPHDLAIFPVLGCDSVKIPIQFMAGTSTRQRIFPRLPRASPARNESRWFAPVQETAVDPATKAAAAIHSDYD